MRAAVATHLPHCCCCGDCCGLYQLDKPRAKSDIEARGTTEVILADKRNTRKRRGVGSRLHAPTAQHHRKLQRTAQYCWTPVHPDLTLVFFSVASSKPAAELPSPSFPAFSFFSPFSCFVRWGVLAVTHIVVLCACRRLLCLQAPRRASPTFGTSACHVQVPARASALP